MSFAEHLEELRRRLFRILIALGLAFPIAFSFAGTIRTFLAAPMTAALPKEMPKPVALGALDPFMLDLQLSLVAAVFFTSPFLFAQIWAFVAPGLYKHERRYILPFLTAGSLFFVGGASFCYYFALPALFRFGIAYMGDDLIPMLDIGTNLGLSAKLLLAFGIVFELPMLIFLLAAAGLVTPDMLTRYRRHAIVLSFVIGAVLTPPDVMSQLMMAIPTVVLFEVGVLAARFVARDRKDSADGEPGSELA